MKLKYATRRKISTALKRRWKKAPPEARARMLANLKQHKKPVVVEQQLEIPPQDQTDTAETPSTSVQPTMDASNPPVSIPKGLQARIPDALALSLTDSLVAAWAQGPGTDVPDRHSSADPADQTDQTEQTDPTTYPTPTPQERWAERVVGLAERTHAAVLELWQDRAQAPKAGILADALDGDLRGPAMVLDDVAHAARDAVTAFIRSAPATQGPDEHLAVARRVRHLQSVLKTFCELDRIRRHRTGEPAPQRSRLPAPNNGLTPITQIRLRLGRQLDALSTDIATLTLPTRSATPPQATLPLAKVFVRFKSFLKEQDKLFERYRDEDKRVDLQDVHTSLNRHADAVRTQLREAGSLAISGQRSQAVQRLQDVRRAMEGYAAQWSLFASDERSHEVLYRRRLRQDRDEPPTTHSPEKAEPPVVDTPSAPEPESATTADVMGERILNRMREAVRTEIAAVLSASRDTAPGQLAIQPLLDKFDEVLDGLKSRGGSIREALCSVDDNLTSRLVLMGEYLGGLSDSSRLELLKKIAEESDRVHKRFVTLEEALVGIQSRLEGFESVPEAALEAVPPYDDHIQQRVDAIGGQLAIVIRQNFLQMVEALVPLLTPPAKGPTIVDRVSDRARSGTRAARRWLRDTLLPLIDSGD